MASGCGITKDRARRFVERKIREIDRSRKGDGQVWTSEDFEEQLINWHNKGKRSLTSDEVEALNRSRCALGERGIRKVARSAGSKAIREHGRVRR